MPTDLNSAVQFVQTNAPKAAVLAAFVSVIAYIHAPRLKTLVFSMPVPFTMAYLASGIPINSTHVSGLLLGIGYHWIVYTTVKRWRVPLAAGIAAGVVFYVGMAAMCRSLEVVAFGCSAMVALTLWPLAVMWYRPRTEPGHRSASAWWVKAPTVFVLALTVFGLTGLLRGAVTTFPYAGVFTSYEMRHSLRTLAGQFTINNIAFLAMFSVIWSLQGRLPTPLVLLSGWATLLAALAVIYRLGVGKTNRP